MSSELFRMMRRCAVGVLSAVLVVGCAGVRPAKSKGTAVAPLLPQRIGTIALINDAGFVLIDATEMPAPGTTLKSFSQGGAQTAVLSVGTESKRPFIAADIKSGAPHAGDEVRE